MKYAHLIFILLLSYFTFSQKTVNETQLTKSESKLFLQQELYSGMVFNQFGNDQVKSIYQVNQGLVKGKMIEYWYDSEFKSLNYQDTAELNKLNFQLTTKSNELEAIIQDSINTYKLAMDYLNYEIGGNKEGKLKSKKKECFCNFPISFGPIGPNDEVEPDAIALSRSEPEDEPILNYEIWGNKKCIDLNIKNKEGKLNRKYRKIFYYFKRLIDSYFSKSLILYEKRWAIRELNQQISKETQKPSFIGKKSKEIEQENFIADGNAIIYDSFGNKFGEGNFIKGSQNGAWVYYFNNGAKMADVNFLNGNGIISDSSGIPKNGRDGLFNSYYKNGKLDKVSNYRAGEYDGVFNTFYENGNKREVSNYKAGEYDGVFNTFYENGNKREVSNYKAGELNGMFNTFYENGKPKQVSIYKAGKVEGVFNTFYENGNKQDVSNCKAGKRDGLCTFYDENGKLKEVSNYKAGKRNGLTTEYENGVKTKEGQYVNGSLHGPRILYYENGKIEIKTTIDSTYLEAAGLKGDYYHYNEDGSIRFHEFYNKDGTFKTIKAWKDNFTKNDNFIKINSAELNKPYKCKCCKATINGIKNGHGKEGNEYTPLMWESEMIMESLKEIEKNLKVMGYNNIYDVFRKEIFMYCTLKCARTCY